MTEPSGVYPTAPLPRNHTRPAGFVGSVASANAVSYNIKNLSMTMSELTGFHHPTYRIYTVRLFYLLLLDHISASFSPCFLFVGYAERCTQQ
jgi:hypothetical protein